LGGITYSWMWVATVIKNLIDIGIYNYNIYLNLGLTGQHVC
jgi:hypothetical protein